MEQQLNDIKNVLEEHLSAINDNSLEIQAIFDYVHEVETKLDKLKDRMDQMQLAHGQPIQKQIIAPLNKIERQIFLILYTQEAPLTFEEIANRSSLPLPCVPECLTMLAQKGIPLQRSYVESKLFFRLSPQFRELQAKENLVNLSLQSFME